jgi:hypothetical protein
MGNLLLHGRRESHHLPDHTASPRLRDPMTSPTPHRGLTTDLRVQEGRTIGPTIVHLSTRCLEATVSPAQDLRRLGRTRTRHSHSRSPRTRALGLRRLTPSTRGRSKTVPFPTARRRTQDPRAMRPMADHLRRRLSRCPDLRRCRCRRLESRATRPLSRTSNLALRRPWSCRRKMSNRSRQAAMSPSRSLCLFRTSDTVSGRRLGRNLRGSSPSRPAGCSPSCAPSETSWAFSPRTHRHGGGGSGSSAVPCMSPKTLRRNHPR